MSVLADVDIAREVWKGDLDIDPYKEENLQPASYDLTLGNSFKREKGGDRQRRSQSIRSGPAERREVDADTVEIQPGEFVLGHTEEIVSLPDHITAEVKGRSSLGRLGLIPHTAGWVDPGFEGQITLEFVNHSKHPVVIEAGERIAQIVFSRTESSASTPYGEKDDQKYQGQSGVTESRIEDDR